MCVHACEERRCSPAWGSFQVIRDQFVLLVLSNFHRRAYIPLQAYVEAARVYLDTFGISTILLLTDSQSAIDEAMNCTTALSDVCKGLKFRFVEKKRWKGAEGGSVHFYPEIMDEIRNRLGESVSNW